MKEKYNFSFCYIQRTALGFNAGNLGFWVFQKGKILPVATIELTPCIGRVNNFRLDETEMKEMKEDFKRFSGCDI